MLAFFCFLIHRVWRQALYLSFRGIASSSRHLYPQETASNNIRVG